MTGPFNLVGEQPKFILKKFGFPHSLLLEEKKDLKYFWMVELFVAGGEKSLKVFLDG